MILEIIRNGAVERVVFGSADMGVLHIDLERYTHEELGKFKQNEISSDIENGWDRYYPGTIIDVPSSFSQKIDPAKSTASIGNLEITVSNKNSTKAVSQELYKLLNDDLTLFYRCKAHIVVKDAENTLFSFTGMLTDFATSSFETEYTFTISDFQEEIKKPIFSRWLTSYNAPSLAAITAEINALEYKTGWSVAEYQDGTNTNNEPIMKKKVIFNGYVRDLVLGMLQLSYEKEKSYLGSTSHLGSWKDFVDVESVIAVCDSFKVNSATPSKIYYEFLDTVDDVFEFLSTYVYRMLSCYPRILPSGKLALKKNKQPTVEEAKEIEQDYNRKITDEHIITLEPKKFDFSNIINQCYVETYFDFKEKESAYKTYYVNATSVDKFRKLLPEEPQVIEARLLNKMSHNEMQNVLNNMTDQLFLRFSRELLKVSVTVPIRSKEHLEALTPGELVGFSSRHVINWFDTGKQGLRGISENIAGDNTDPVAKFDSGDSWGGFIENSQYFQHLIPTKEIKASFFNTDLKGSHDWITNWISINS